MAVGENVVIGNNNQLIFVLTNYAKVNLLAYTRFLVATKITKYDVSLKTANNCDNKLTIINIFESCEKNIDKVVVSLVKHCVWV